MMAFYGIIFNNILLDKSMTDKQKLLSAYINSKCGDNLKMIATNEEIGNDLGIKPNTVSKNLSDLQRRGIIHLEIVNLYDRTIHIGRYMKELMGIGFKSQGDMIGITHTISKLIYNITEFENYEEYKETNKNELYIISKGMELGIGFDKHEILKWCSRVKQTIGEYVPRREDGKIDWNLAKSYTNARYDYWENPPKGKKKPTNFKTSLRNNIEMRSKPKTWKK